MKKLLIAGAGVCGREAYQWACDIQKHTKPWESIGFLDDNPHALDKYNMSDAIVGTIAGYVPQPDEEVICAAGDVERRADLHALLAGKGADFGTIIHPSAVLSDNYTMGKDVMVGPGSVISVNAAIGDRVLIDSLTVIGHDTVVESGCIIRDFCDVMGFAHLERDVLLGSGAKILNSVRVGNHAKVGAGSVVLRNVKPDTSVFGNPAKVIYSPKK
jgi:sugar O-acyltransferase (sialic acid O-acetyltransferase NeuD family)